MSDVKKGPPPKDGDRDLGPTLMSVLWVETGLTILIVFLRFQARFMIHRIGWDDWLMLLTLVLFVASTILATLQDSVGGYRHIYYLSEEASIKALEWNFILRGVHIISYAAGKASVGALILRLIGRQNIWQKWVVWGVIVFTAIVNVLNCLFNFIQCDPVEANWNTHIPRKCWNETAQLKFAYFMSSENIVADAILSIIPATILSRLNMSRQRRWNLSILLGLGSMAMICGVVKTIELNSISNDPDFTWGEYALTIWGLSEVFVIIICGSIPTLKPLWDRYITKEQSESSSERLSDSPDGYRMRNVYHARIPSVSCQIERSSPIIGTSCPGWSPGGGIRATTSIEVFSSETKEKSDLIHCAGTV